MTTPTSLPAWLPLLRKPYDDILGSRTTWQLALPGGIPVRVERAGQGLTNSLYCVKVQGEVFACKLFVADERRRAERTWAALSALHAAGLRLAPRPVALALDGPLPQPAIVSAWLEGTSLAQQPPGAADLDHLIAALAACHRVGAAAGEEFLPAYGRPAGYAAYLDGARALLGQVRAWAADTAGRPRQELPLAAADVAAALPFCEEALAAAEQSVAAASSDGHCPCPGLIRADGSLDGVLRVAGGRLALINWENSGYGDPAYDLAELRWHPQALKVPAAAWAAALAAYPIPPDDPDFAERCAVYDRLLPAWWVARSAVHLLEGAGELAGRPRLARVPARFYRTIRSQLEQYLAALGLVPLPAAAERDED